MLRKFITSYLWIALLTSIFVIFTDHKIIPEQGTWNMLELRTIDYRFLFKNKPEKSASKDIALILIDDKTYKEIKEPLIFYHTYITEVIDYLVKGGVDVIGLDIQLPSISLEEKITGGYDSFYFRSFLKARKKGTHIVIGFSSREDAPLKSYQQVAGKENLATFNLTVDADDFVRRQQLSEKGFDSFPFLLARKFADKQLSPPGQTILIDYSLASDIPVFSFYDVYQLSKQEGVQKNLFKDKVVIIGTLFASEDKHPTPLYYSQTGEKNKRTAGVVIQAATLNTLLSGKFFHEPGALSGAFYILLASLITVLLCFNQRPLHAAVYCIAEAGGLIFISIYTFSHYYVIHLTPLLLAVLVSYGTTTVFHYYTEERKRIRIKELFASYVPEQIIEQIVDKNIKELTEGEEKEVVLFFTDIRDFTDYSEKNIMYPTKVVSFLNLYHKEMSEIILSNNGTVAQLAGDGIFAFFGAPVKHDAPIPAAVKSALQMKEKIAELKPKWKEYGMDDLKIGVGIHIGDCIIGNIGSTIKMEYTAIGDSVNVASRIEGLTKDFSEMILISADAYERVRDKVIARPLGPANIKGHSKIEIFAVDGIRH